MVTRIPRVTINAKMLISMSVIKSGENEINRARQAEQISIYINFLASILAALSAPRIISRDAAGSQGVFDNTASMIAGIC